VKLRFTASFSALVSSGRCVRAGLVAAILGLTLALAGEPSPAKEYAVKAAFLYNFTKFIEWPPESLGAPQRPFVIGVFGRDSFDELERVVRGRKVNGRRIEVKILHTAADVVGSHLVFVSGTAGQEVMAACRRHRVLAVGESKEFLEEGGAIAFVFKEAKLRFAINIQATKHAGLKVSAHLQKLAVNAGRKR